MRKKNTGITSPCGSEMYDKLMSLKHKINFPKSSAQAYLTNLSRNSVPMVWLENKHHD